MRLSCQFSQLKLKIDQELILRKWNQYTIIKPRLVVKNDNDDDNYNNVNDSDNDNNKD